SRTQHGDKCTISLLRDDMKRLGYDVKNMRRWLAKLEKDETIRIDGDDVVPL
ncbi:TPA: DNA primase, partial [Escherichia coli]